jgi:hypothetical protein
MSGFAKGGWMRYCVVAVAATAGIGLAHPQAGVAQTRTLATLADVPTFVPAPYHPHMSTAHLSSALYDSHPYYGGAYLGGGPRYWH